MIQSALYYLVLIPAAWVVINYYIPWPDIPESVFDIIRGVVAALYTLNRYIALDTLFFYAFFIVVIEILIWATSLIFKLLFGSNDRLTTDDRINGN